MAKPKSLKLRTLITLHVLFKHTDKNHRLNMVKLNEYLRPYGLECTARVLRDTVKVLRDVGIEVESKGEWDHQGVWLPNRPLSDNELNYLIFAVTTNPHLSNDQATYALQGIKPFVTVYQEDLLKGFIETNQTIEPDDTLYWVYSVVHDAIIKKRRIRYTVDYIKYDKETQSAEKQRQWMTLFTPKRLYQTNNRIYMIGYNHNDKKVSAVDLREITDIKIAFKHKDKNADIAQRFLENVSPQELIPGEYNEVVYAGPVTFRCRGQYITELYNMFGPPDEPVIKDKRSKTTYTVNNASITTETLFWLSQIKDYGVRLVGPEPLLERVKQYYQSLSCALTDYNLR